MTIVRFYFIILSLWYVFIKKTPIPRFDRSKPFFKAWHSQYGSWNSQRGLGLSLIRSCGAKSNQSKRERRAKPFPSQGVSAVCSVRSLSHQHLPGGKRPPLCCSCSPLSPFLLFNSQGKREWEGWRVFASYSSPCSHCLTLTRQYDTNAIWLSLRDITTVLPAAGAWGLLH